jgi:bla regulator protein blaR1
MIAYLIKFILCSGFLYSFYKIFLERESMYKINRFYLMFSLIFALIAPLYKIEVPLTAQQTNISPELLAWIMNNPEFIEQQNGFNFGELLNIVYIIIGVLLLARFSYNLYELLFKVKTEERIEDHKITYILDLESEQPYSFWKYVFIPKKNINQIHQNLIDHEKAHCIQKHSFDIILIELFQIIFWFNPFIYFYKKSIKLNHEFLADEYVLKRNADLKMYQHQILDCIASQTPSLMASNFNFILTKKRLIMMTKHTSSRKVKILSFASFPFLLSAFVLFSQKSFAQEVEKRANKVEKALDKPLKSQADLIFGTQEKITLQDTLSAKKVQENQGRTVTKEELKNILKKNPTNKIILNDAGEIILNDTIKIKEIVSQKDLVPTILYDKNGNILKSINPDEISKVNVYKKEGFIEVYKKDSTKFKIYTKDLPNVNSNNIQKLTPITKNGIDYKSVKLVDGFAVYTDKNGIEHKIPNAKIEEIYLNQKGEKVKVLSLGSFKVSEEDKVTNKDKTLESTADKNPWKITIQPHNKKSKYQLN